MSALPLASGPPAHESEASLDTDLGSWVTRSPYYDPNIVSASRIRSKDNLNFRDGNTVSWLVAKEQKVSFHPQESIETGLTRKVFVESFCGKEQDLSLVSLPDDHLAKRSGHFLLSKGLFVWLLELLKVHPLFVEMVLTTSSRFAIYETPHPSSNELKELHLIFRLCSANRWLESAFYIRYTVDTRKLYCVLAGQPYE